MPGGAEGEETRPAGGRPQTKASGEAAAAPGTQQRGARMVGPSEWGANGERMGSSGVMSPDGTDPDRDQRGSRADQDAVHQPKVTIN